MDLRPQLVAFTHTNIRIKPYLMPYALCLYLMSYAPHPTVKVRPERSLPFVLSDVLIPIVRVLILLYRTNTSNCKYVLKTSNIHILSQEI